MPPVRVGCCGVGILKMSNSLLPPDEPPPNKSGGGDLAVVPANKSEGSADFVLVPANRSTTGGGCGFGAAVGVEKNPPSVLTLLPSPAAAPAGEGEEVPANISRPVPSVCV